MSKQTSKKQEMTSSQETVINIPIVHSPISSISSKINLFQLNQYQLNLNINSNVDKNKIKKKSENIFNKFVHNYKDNEDSFKINPYSLYTLKNRSTSNIKLNQINDCLNEKSKAQSAIGIFASNQEKQNEIQTKSVNKNFKNIKL